MILNLWGNQTQTLGEATESGIMPNPPLGSAPTKTSQLRVWAHISRFPQLIQGTGSWNLQHCRPNKARRLCHSSDQETATVRHLHLQACLKPKPPTGASLWQSPGPCLCPSCQGRWEESVVSCPKRQVSQSGKFPNRAGVVKSCEWPGSLPISSGGTKGWPSAAEDGEQQWAKKSLTELIPCLFQRLVHGEPERRSRHAPALSKVLPGEWRRQCPITGSCPGRHVNVSWGQLGPL